MTMKINTPAELRSACCLRLCYSDEQLAAHLPLTLTSLLAVPPDDALHCLAGLLPQAQRVEWAEASARRAKEYAANAANAANAADAAADAARAADTARAANTARAAWAAWAAAADAARAAARAARATATANAAARATADWAAEQRIAIRHAALLLGLPE